MRSVTLLCRLIATAVAMLVFCGGTRDLPAQEQESAKPPAADRLEQLDDPDEHRHDPVDVDARPIITRSNVPLIRPRRLLLDPDGSLFIADWGAGTVLKATPDETTTVLADDLHEPAGLARDVSGNLYVTTHAEGMTRSGTVVRIATDGEQSVFAEGLTGPTAIAYDPHGDLYVANVHDNSI
jgi:sugar lactone lactonase YvrE